LGAVARRLGTFPAGTHLVAAADSPDVTAPQQSEQRFRHSPVVAITHSASCCRARYGSSAHRPERQKEGDLL
jgi:hypothetical protein